MLRRNGAGQETMESVRKREGSLGWKRFVEHDATGWNRILQCLGFRRPRQALLSDSAG